MPLRSLRWCFHSRLNAAMTWARLGNRSRSSLAWSSDVSGAQSHKSQVRCGDDGGHQPSASPPPCQCDATPRKHPLPTGSGQPGDMTRPRTRGPTQGKPVVTTGSSHLHMCACVHLCASVCALCALCALRQRGPVAGGRINLWTLVSSAGSLDTCAQCLWTPLSSPVRSETDFPLGGRFPPQLEWGPMGGGCVKKDRKTQVG